MKNAYCIHIAFRWLAEWTWMSAHSETKIADEYDTTPTIVATTLNPIKQGVRYAFGVNCHS